MWSRIQFLHEVGSQPPAPRSNFQDVAAAQLFDHFLNLPRQAGCEDITKFRGSDEITLNAKGRVFDVVSMFGMQQTDLHKVRNTHWTIQRYTFAYDAIQRRHADTGLLRIIRNRPINIIGTDSSCPMVNPHSPNWMT